MLMTMLAVRLSSPGPAIFQQRRVGRNGRIYTMYKIRSMRLDAEAKSGPVWTTTNDPRVTRVGRFIRKLHLDEFPQLVNVLKGEMALIGPRPERPEFVELLAREIPGYMDRLSVRPGITGLAQINLPPDTDIDSVRKKLAVDLEYIRRGSVSLDLRILACTFVRLLGISGQHAAHLCGLDCRKVAENATVALRPTIENAGFSEEGAAILLPRDA
jgi:lipopolysaccharide/colanic/teichoic acid biosynthesis glycosyltransferase